MEGKKRVIKLLCPCLSKIVTFTAWEEQRLDIGSIASAFELDPSSLKLNGHFISRGVDLVSSSVTWKSLVSFFCARGLSTGDSDSAAIIVEGRPSRVGSKRSHNPAEVGEEMLNKKERSNEREAHLDDTNFLSNKRFKETTTGGADSINNFSKCNGLNLKRKFCLEDSGLLKRTRTNECYSGLREREVDIHKAISDRPLLCSLSSDRLKRIRDDEMVVTAPFKRIR